MLTDYLKGFTYDFLEWNRHTSCESDVEYRKQQGHGIWLPASPSTIVELVGTNAGPYRPGSVPTTVALGVFVSTGAWACLLWQ